MSETHHLAYEEPEKIKSIDAEFLSGKRFPYQEDMSLVEDVDLLASTPGEDINWLEDIELLEEDGTPGGLRPLLELVHQDLLPDPRGPGERDRPQGADDPPADRQLLRHPAEGDPLQVPAARARAVGGGVEDGRHRLEAARPRRLGSAAALTMSLAGRRPHARPPPARAPRSPDEPELEELMSEKMWGDEPFWGLGYDWDPDWVLTDRQKGLRETLISLCEKEMRANAKRSDDELLFPRRNLELLGEHGFLALCVPEEYGGLGENHVGFAMAARDDRALRLRVDGDVLRHAHGRRRGADAAPDPRDRRQVHPPAQLRPDRDALLLRPGDRLALLVPGLVARRARRTAATRSTRRRRGRRPAASPTSTSCRRRAPTSRATTTSPSSSSTRSTARRSRRSGTRSACAATSRARSRSPTSRSRARSSSAPRATAPTRTTRPSTRGS